MIAEARRAGEVYSVLTWKNGGAAGFWSRALGQEKIPKTVMPKALRMPIACVRYLQTAC